MKLILLICIMMSFAFAQIPEPCLEEERVLITKGIDLDTKTLKGWIRLLKNRSKQGAYGVTLSASETAALIKCLNIELENRKLAGKMQ